MKPVKLLDLGGENDPCFGKLYSLTAPECARCGDYEACSIATQSRMLKEVESEESSKPFKDVQEAELITQQDKELKLKMVKMAKKTPNKWISLEKIVPIARTFWNLTEVEDANIFQRLSAQAKKSKKLILKGRKFKYNDE